MKTILILLAFVWTTMAAQQQPADAGSGVSAAIQQLEQTRFDAIRRKDNATLNDMLDNALVWVNPDGVQSSKANYLASLRSTKSEMVDISAESMTVHVFESTAIVFGIYREKGLKNGRPFLQRARFIDTWALKHGKWVCIAATATSSL